MRFRRILRIASSGLRAAPLVLGATIVLALAAGPASAMPAAAPTPVRVAIDWHRAAAPADFAARQPMAAGPAAVRPMVTCSGYGCDNKDPKTTGCADGSQYTVVSGNVAIGGVTYATINLRYSPTCGTNWAQITNNHTGDYADIKVCRDEVDLRCSDTYFTGAETAWSNQMYAYDITATAYATLYLDSGQAKGSATA